MKRDERTNTKRYYGCRDCQRRLTAGSFRAECSDGGGPLRNIAVPRE